MTKEKMIKIGLISLGAVLLLLAAGAITLTLLKHNQPIDRAKGPTSGSAKDELSKGRKAELGGDAQVALDHYKQARSLCDKSDSQCLMDTEIKISIMETTLREQKNPKKQKNTIFLEPSPK